MEENILRKLKSGKFIFYLFPVLLFACVVDLNAQNKGRSLSKIEEKIKTFKKVRGVSYRASYDKLKDKTNVGATGIFIARWTEPEGLSLKEVVRDPVRKISCGVFFHFSGDTIKTAPTTFYFAVDANGGEGRFLFEDFPGILFYADNELIELGNGKRVINNPPVRDTISIGSSEHMLYSIDPSVFEKFAKAKKIELRIGNRMIKLKPETIEVFANIFSLSQIE